MYRVLYRKWRPQTFADVVGQEHITSTLAHEVQSGKVSHAYLFTGSRGTGKTTCAKILAKAANCLNPVDGNPCNECAVCKGLDDGSILDVIEIDAASNNGVDNIRDLREEANYTPVHTKYRVYIIDEVHMLSIGAFNALLKTLEEPPSHVKFILATTEVHKLPATILSRCQRFDFHRITPENITSRLRYVAECENIDLDEDAALLIARIADGAMRDALSILDRCSGITNHVTTEVVSNAAGLAGKDYLFELVDNINENNPSEVLSIVAKLHNDSCDMERLCTELINHYRNLMIIKTVKDPQKLIVCTDIDLESYKKQADKTTLFKILSCITTLEECSAMLKSSSSKRTEMEMSVIKLCIPDISSDNTAILSRIERLENMLKDGKITVSAKIETKPQEKQSETPAPAPVQEKKEEAPLPPPPPEAPTAPVQDTSPDVDVLFTGWGEVLEKLNVTDKPLTGILGSSSAYIRGDFLLIKCDNPVFSQFIRQGNHANAIKTAVYEVTGRKFRLGIYKSDDSKANSNDPLADLVNKINNLQ
ncbi:MAG: DNA polymerase III subunit gamma/tau [Clostridia bacterium]|nr:DNA polymerase III subunit gamma/tau [Clostridia bacterium]